MFCIFRIFLVYVIGVYLVYVFGLTEKNMSNFANIVERIKSTVDPAEGAKIWDEVKKLKASDGTKEEFVDIICAGISNPTLYNLRCSNTAKKAIKWRNYFDGVCRVVDELLKKTNFKIGDEGDSWAGRDIYSEIETLVKEFVDDFKEQTPNPKAATKWCQVDIDTAKYRTKWHTNIQYRICGSLDKFEVVNVSIKEEFANALLKLVKDETEPKWYDDHSFHGMHGWTWSAFLKSVKMDAEHKKCRDTIFELFNILLTRELADDRNSTTFFGGLVLHIMINYLRTNIVHQNCDFDLFKEYLPILTEWKNKDEDDLSKFEIEYLKVISKEIIDHLTKKDPNLINTDDIEGYCKSYINDKNYQTSDTIKSAYAKGNEKTKATIEKYILDFIKCLPDSTHGYYNLMEIFKMIYREKPKLIEKHLDAFDSLVGSPITNVENSIAGSYNYQLMALLALIASKNRQLFANRGADYYERVRKFNTAEYIVGTQSALPVLKEIAFMDEAHAENVVQWDEKELKNFPGRQDIQLLIVCNWYYYAQEYPKLFKSRLPVIREFLKVAQLKQMAQGIIDIVEGRSLKKVSDDVEKHDKDIKQLDTEVGKTKKDVDKLDKRVDQHDVDIKENRDNINATNTRVNDLGERVDVAEEKIIDIDNKTVSNAPAWSKDVSKLLNPIDWVQVAQRLNYNSSEIRGWATQPDPTMSMLAEFYTTNKTSEATKFLLKVLKDLNRRDAVAIIERSQQNTQSVVDNDDGEYKAPPSVFISYQWGHQKQIKLLKEYIEKEGYTCWMDLGQMGGGDMLYEKINDGIRSAKIVLLCMSEQYCKSANCIREVNLANGLDKLIIPLTLEKDLSWPPPGSMGPILAGKLFIRFFQRPNEVTSDERFWPPEMYKQLMEKIRGAVGEPTKDVVSVGAIPQKTNVKPPVPPPQPKLTPQDVPKGKSKNSFKVCISCSPDKDSQMKSLQNDLAAAGYDSVVSCYVEDSVAEFDAQVYICALDLRYTKSSMACKEIDLIVSNRKPLVPLLMYSTEYPPSGPMKRLLSRCTPIDCSNSNPTSNSHQFKELVKTIDTCLTNGNAPSTNRRGSNSSLHGRNSARGQKLPSLNR